jgi:hypothetical protein
VTVATENASIAKPIDSKINDITSMPSSIIVLL